jgi:hypothetical protein
MIILKKTDSNINLSILVFSLFAGLLFFSIYFLLCIKGYNIIVSDSYDISAEQLAKSISIPIKINNIRSVMRAVTDSFTNPATDNLTLCGIKSIFCSKETLHKPWIFLPSP